ncbi:MAG: DNA-directed RNA polymerase subunit alpha [Candidatus Cloacimonetes bacterium]|nr:DNA-directed RNA polymerase subunit alpha [Candidatus Cloacimonadota bacterium]
MLLEPIQLPDSVEFDKKSYSQTYGKFEIGPIEPGYGTTVGNTLRRVLLSSIQGAAVRFVRIEGLFHEFAPIPGTDSDYIDLILRLKKLVFKTESINEIPLVLEKKGPGVVTAADIIEIQDIDILNKDLVLLEITEQIDFRLELWVGIGRGYVPSDKQEMEERPIGVVPIDSIYSPITKVNFSVEHTRVKEKMNYDKLMIEVFTNGAIEPRDALFLSAKLLKDLYSKIARFEVEPEYIEEVQMDPELERLDKLLNMSVKELELTVRSANCLAAAKIESIGDLVRRTEPEMLKYRNFGKKSLDEISKLLVKYDLTLGMDVDEKLSQIEEAKNRVITKKKV